MLCAVLSCRALDTGVGNDSLPGGRCTNKCGGGSGGSGGGSGGGNGGGGGGGSGGGGGGGESSIFIQLRVKTRMGHNSFWAFYVYITRPHH